MDEELKQFLTQIAARQDARMDRMDARLEAMDRKFDAMDRKFEHVETALLTGFHKWTSPVEARARGTREALHALDLEMDLLKDRVAKLEGQKPPHVS